MQRLPMVDPLALASWPNVVPVDNPQAVAWWLAALVATVTARDVVDGLVENLAVTLAVVARRARA
jgi:hypothetical protein